MKQDLHNNKHKWDLFKNKIKLKQDKYGIITDVEIGSGVYKKEDGGEFRGLNQENCKIIVQYLFDMEKGSNISGAKKGGRSYSRLNALKIRIPQMARWFQKNKKKNLINLNHDVVNEYFNALDKGIIKSNKGTKYKSVRDFKRDFQSFWHWYMKFMKRLYRKSDKNNGGLIEDITDEIDVSREKPKFNYFDVEQLQKLIDVVKFDYKVMMLFMYDSGCRSPSELMHIKKSDLQEHELMKDVYTLHIREEISKTIGRKIKLMLCGKLLKRYLEKYDFKDDDYLFKGHPSVINQYLKRVGYKLLKMGNMRKGKNGDTLIIDGITMYDFRHSSACYWLQRYKNQNTLMYRFGWVKPEMVYYYSEFLGLKDDITEQDLDTAEISSQLQKELKNKDTQIILQEEKMDNMQKQMKKIQEKIAYIEKGEKKIKEMKQKGIIK